MEFRYSIFLTTLVILGILGSVPLGSTGVSGTTLQVHLSGFKVVGTLSSDTNVVFAVFLPLKNEGYLFYYAEAVSNPSSPLYHKFLSQQQVEKLFYPVQTYEYVLNQLKQDGFNVLFTASDSVIVAEGTVAQVHKYLGVSYEVFSNGTVSYYSAYGVPRVPGFIYSSNVSEIVFSHPTTLVTQKDVLSPPVPNYTAPIEAYWGTALQKVYNATALYAKGDEGQGRAIGILDFFGDPYIYQQLVYYDKVTGLPNPPSFKVVPIGPYNPNLGITTGWAGEISLDVEIAHTMAPEANITLFIANGALPLASIIAEIDSLDNVNVVSQSFSIPESFFSLFNAQAFYACVVETDVYYAMGNAEGITFLASSGDAGGSGYSNGPLGTVGYPATSPFVTAVGGTTTYVQFPGSSYQTAWSNYGFVPNDVNYGGSTGGISEIEPKPFYQWSLTTPSSYPNGKEIPDISANANIYPGIYIVFPGNQTFITGGTSEASPLTAGLLTLVMDYVNSSLGNVNPMLYELAYNSSTYSKVFNPITFGYNIPWTASFGYNLVTGWGTLNVGELAWYASKVEREPSLSVVVNVENATGQTPVEFFPGEVMRVLANVTNNGTEVTSGKFYAAVESTEGNLTIVPLVYSPSLGMWTANVTLPSDANGVLFVNVYGTSDGLSGKGFFETFSGYYVQFLFPMTFIPVYTGLPTPVVANVTNVYGEQATSPVTVNIYYYNPLKNEYSLVNNITLTPVSGATLGLPGLIWVSLLPQLPVGDLYISATNAFGYVSFTNGIYLQSLFVLPQVIAEPGAVYPGQYLLVEGNVVPPVQTGQSTSLQNGLPVSNNIEVGSNITAELVSLSGKVVSTASIPFNGIEYLGYLYVPNVTSGLYMVFLNASYDSITLGENVTGFFYGEVYVGPQSLVNVKVTNYAYEGQTVEFTADVTYSNGTPVTFGMFSATVYPQQLSGQYSTISQILEVPLWYNATLGQWEGNFTLPSAESPGNLTYDQGVYYYGAPFEILITGVSSLGSPTSTALSHAKTFYVLPYTEIEGKTLDGFQSYYAYLVKDMIAGNVTLMDDVMYNDTVEGQVKVVDSNASDVTFYNSDVLLYQVQGSGLTFVNSKVVVMGSDVEGIKLVNSSISYSQSVLNGISPALPTVSFVSPSEASNLTGNVTVKVTITGDDVAKDYLYLDGARLATFTGNGTFTYTLDTASYPDGTYNLTFVAVQADGMSSSSSVLVNFNNELSSLSQGYSNLSQKYQNLSTKLTSLEESLASNASTLSSGIASLNNNLNGVKSALSDVGVLAVIALIVGVVGIALALRKRPQG
ncbi:MAG: protease pro-enzyme activation domain-containing protein [Candidatus Aramenus sp.]|jgi:subtilase family serine protease|nr:protease pro-enzyme activation domain-containing protein [Candidatus Aramenus sp.]